MSQSVSVTLLHVDEDFDLPAGFAARLTAEGYRLVQTEDPEEARRSVASGEPDLVLVDPLLSTCDGMALLEELASTPALKVVVYTRGDRSAELWGRALQLGLGDVVPKPATAAQLLQSIEAALGDESAAGTDAKTPTSQAGTTQPAPADLSGSQRPLRDRGSLAEDRFAALLRGLRTRAWSGVAIVSRGEERVGIQLRNGNPSAVSAPGVREPLEAFLLRIGRISSAQYERLQEQLSVGRRSSREILLEMDVLSEEALDEAARTQGDELLLRAFGWSSGDYHLLPGKRIKSGALEVARSAASLLFEGALRESPMEDVRRELERCAMLYVSESCEVERVGTEIGITPAMTASVQKLQGDRTLGEVSSSGDIDERLLYALLVAGLLELHEKPVLLLVEVVKEGPAPRTEAIPAQPAVTKVPDDAPSKEERCAQLDARLQNLKQCDAYAVLGTAEETDEAIRACYEARLLELDRESRGTHDSKLARRLQQIRDRVEEAYEQIRDDDARSRYQAIRRQEEEDRAARETAERALEAERWFRKGSTCLNGRLYAEAVEAFGMAAHLDPDEGEYLAHLGWALYLTNPKDEMVRREANEHLARGIKRTRDRPLPYVYLGRMFNAVDAHNRARKMFQKALQLDPDCHPALQELRLLNMRKQKSKGLLGRLRGK